MKQLSKHIVGIMAFTLGVSTPAHAQLACGDTVDTGTTVVLQADVGPCDDETGGITVNGPATLNLNGFHLDCADLDGDGELADGIWLEGEQAVVRGGQVEGCEVGVVVAGEGRHRVEKMAGLDNRTGYQVLSSRNRLDKNGSYETRDLGFELWGDDNRLTQNVVYDGVFGFFLYSSRNTLSKNEAEDSSQMCFYISGGPTYRNTLTRNIATSCLLGFRVDGEQHTLSQNIATLNGRGFELLGGRQHILRNNTAEDNRWDGFYIFKNSVQNKLIANRAERNGRHGISAGSPGFGVTFDNLLSKNIAKDNNTIGTPNGFDLYDGAPDCGTNAWKNNTFGSANPTWCIQ